MNANQISNILHRGVFEVLPNAESLAQLMAKRKIRLYLGIDPTGSLLTIGHGVVLRKLQQFADLGHDVILLIGNGTVRIGDPTGKDSTRPVLTDEEIMENFKNWKAQASKILDFDKIRILHNGDWLDKLTYSDLVKLLGKVTVQQLLERDMFQERMKQGKPIHGHEILYPMLQGYDSVAMDVDLEIGGSDQTFNMLMGRTLQKVYNNREKWVLSTPIINGTDGRKMSKSYHNFVALNEEPNEMFGKLMSVADEQMLQYFEVLTDENLEEITKLIDTDPRNAKVHLAKTIVTWLHDENAAEKAYHNFTQKFVNKEIPDEMPEFRVEPTEIGILDLISKVTDFAPSNSEARRLVQNNAVTLNDEKITDPNFIVQLEDGMILKVGKKKFARIRR